MTTNNSYYGGGNPHYQGNGGGGVSTPSSGSSGSSSPSSPSSTQKGSKFNTVVPSDKAKFSLRGAANKIYIEQSVLEKIQAYIDICPVEISGLGLVEETKYGLVVTEIFLLEQECTPGSTDIDVGDLSRLMSELAEQGKLEKLKFWWHSEVA